MTDPSVSDQDFCPFPVWSSACICVLCFHIRVCERRHLSDPVCHDTSTSCLPKPAVCDDTSYISLRTGFVIPCLSPTYLKPFLPGNFCWWCLHLFFLVTSLVVSPAWLQSSRSFLRTVLCLLQHSNSQFLASSQLLLTCCGDCYQ